MRTQRIAQNFRGRKAVIFAAHGGSIDVLEGTLRRLGVESEIRGIRPGQTLELPTDLSVDEHVALIDGDLILPPQPPIPTPSRPSRRSRFLAEV